MKTREMTVLARTVTAAKDQAVALARQDRFDPLRVTVAVCQGVQEVRDDGMIFRYRIVLQGNELTEAEARGLYGDR